MSTDALSWCAKLRGYKGGPSGMLRTMCDMARPPDSKKGLPSWLPKVHRGEEYILWPSYEELADRHGCSPRSVHSHLELLVATGAVGRRERRDDRGYFSGYLYWINVGAEIDFDAFVGMPGIKRTREPRQHAEFASRTSSPAGKFRGTSMQILQSQHANSAGPIDETPSETPVETTHTEQASPVCDASLKKVQGVPFTAKAADEAAARLFAMWPPELRKISGAQLAKKLNEASVQKKRHPDDFVVAGRTYLAKPVEGARERTWLGAWFDRAEYDPFFPPKQISLSADEWTRHMLAFATSGAWDDDELGESPTEQGCCAPWDAYRVALFAIDRPGPAVNRLLRAIRARFPAKFELLETLDRHVEDLRFDRPWTGAGQDPRLDAKYTPPYLYAKYGIPYPASATTVRQAAAE